MTLVGIEPDPAALSVTTTCEFDAPPERVWQVWADARQLERWWGPPGYRLTFTRHDFVVPGGSTFVMAGPDGAMLGTLYWHYRLIEPPARLVVADGRSAEEGGGTDGAPGPSDMEVRLAPLGPGTRMTVTSRFATPEELEEHLRMGTEEELARYWGQIDDVLAAG